MRISTTDLFDQNPTIARSCRLQFRDLGGLNSFAGPIRTVRCRNDNILLRSMLDELGNGAVAVVDGDGSLEVALMGDMIAAKAAANGWCGIVINGAVRDVRALATLEFGVKALGTNPARSNKEGTGEVDVPVDFGGMRFEPGHWIYCDEDGILISPKML